MTRTPTIEQTPSNPSEASNNNACTRCLDRRSCRLPGFVASGHRVRLRPAVTTMPIIAAMKAMTSTAPLPSATKAGPGSVLGPVEPAGEQGPTASSHEPDDRCVHRDRARHHEGELRIPRAGHIEKRRHGARCRHPGNHEPGREQRTRERGEHDRLHAAAPATSTTIAALAMNVSTATSDRFDSRARPQTPCPLVQPFASVVPAPTRIPASTSIQSPRIGAPSSPGATHPTTSPTPTMAARKREPETLAIAPRTRDRAAERAADPDDPAVHTKCNRCCESDQCSTKKPTHYRRQPSFGMEPRARTYLVLHDAKSALTSSTLSCARRSPRV